MVAETLSKPGAEELSSRSAEDRLACLFARVSARQDAAAREELVEHFLPLARKLARRYARSSEPYEDLAQVASLALVKAVDRFDPARGIRFEAFAIPTILGDLKRYFRDCTWSVHVSRRVQEQTAAIENANRDLSRNNCRAPSALQIAEYLELPLEDVLEGLQAGQAYNALSLDAPRGSKPDDEDFTIGDLIGDVDQGYEQVEERLAVAGAAHVLSERERRVLQLRFVAELTQTEIAAEVGISQMQVSRVLRRSLERLRALADA